MRTAACITTHRPIVARVAELARAIATQVDLVVVVADATVDVLGLARALRGVAQVLPMPQGPGSGEAMNGGVRWLAARGAEAVVLLDQDAGVPGDLVRRLLPHLDDPRVAIASSDRGRSTGTARYVDACTMSGSVLRVDAWRALGGWDDTLVGDFADYDLCLRVRRAGTAIVLDPSVVVSHARPAAPAASAAPVFADVAHDAVYFARKHRGVPRSIRVAGRGLLRTYGALVMRAVGVLRHETDRRAKVGGIVRGALAGSIVRVAA